MNGASSTPNLTFGRSCLKRLNKIPDGKMALWFDTLHLSIGQGAKLLIQAAYFILVARSLGPTAYGAFIAITALTGIISPFSGLGSSNLFIKNLRCGLRTARVCWGNGLVLTVASGVAFSFFITACNVVIGLHAAFSTIFIVALCDLVLMRIADLAGFGFAAAGDMKQLAIQNVVMRRIAPCGYCPSCLALSYRYPAAMGDGLCHYRSYGGDLRSVDGFPALGGPRLGPVSRPPRHTRGHFFQRQ